MVRVFGDNRFREMKPASSRECRDPECAGGTLARSLL